jgi:hypothetical protein
MVMTALLNWSIDLSVIHYTVHPEELKGADRLVIGLRYLSPNGMFVTNYGMLNNSRAAS